jgi:hypothetical protein
VAKGIPLWKIGREIDRMIKNLKRKLSRVYEPILLKSYDKHWENQLQAHSGDMPVAEKIALILIFQPEKLRASTFETCLHLIKAGYAPLIVSNSEISNSDLIALKLVCWKAVVRPNVGYDFGGYRDGLRFMNSLDVRPRRVLILNDSIWFPTDKNETLLAQMEASDADLVGAIYQEGDHSRPKNSSRRNGFIESFFYLINASCLDAPAFKEFWETYRLSNLKYNAVYDGERQFDKQIKQAGLKVASILTRTSLLEKLELQTSDFLRQVLVYAAYTDLHFAAKGAELIHNFDASAQWKMRTLAHIEQVSAKRHFHSSFCVATMTLLGASFLKKGSGTVLAKGYGLLHHEMRTQYVLAISEGVLPAPSEAILNEINEMQAGLVTSFLPREART